MSLSSIYQKIKKIRVKITDFSLCALKKTQNNISFLRWLDILFLSVISASVCSFFISYIFKMGMLYTQVLSQSCFVSFTQNSLVIMVISLLLINFGGLHPLYKLKTMIKYPPFWVSAPIATAIYLVYLTIFNEYFSLVLSKNLLASILTIPVGALSAFLAYLVFYSESEDAINHQAEPIEKTNIFMDASALKSWIFDEKSIEHPNQDIFGSHIIAKKIALYLLKDRSCNIGLIGSYGVGKSTTINLVNYYLKDPNLKLENNIKQRKTTLITCSIDGWGLSHRFVAKNILEAILSQVKKHVDCFSVLGLPENYRKTLAGSKKVGGDIFASILEPSQSPFYLLKKLDQILLIANLKVVIFLEDLDRNSSDEIIRDEVPSLMDRLKKLNSFSCVLAIGTERMHSDAVVRICDYTENI